MLHSKFCSLSVLYYSVGVVTNGYLALLILLFLFYMCPKYTGP